MMFVISGVPNTVICFTLSNVSTLVPLADEVSNDMFIIHASVRRTGELNFQFASLVKIYSLCSLSESLIFTDSTISSVLAVTFTKSPTLIQVSGSTITVASSPDVGLIVKFIVSEAHTTDQSISKISMRKACFHSRTSLITC
jgi:hypothetical protein